MQKLLLGPVYGADDEERKQQAKVYKLVLQEFLPCVIGEAIYKRDRGTKLVHEYSTVSDEGFVLVILENFNSTWSEMHKGKLEQSVWKRRNSDRDDKGLDLLPEDQRAVKPLYSDGGSGSNEHQGWKDEGIERFRHLCFQVKGWRMNELYKKMEERLLGEYKYRETSVSKSTCKKA